MTIKSILHDTKGVLQALDNSADNETLTGNGVDMQGYDSVCFITGAQLGEELTFTQKVQQATDDEYSDAADLADSSDSFTTDVYTDGLLFTEVHHPRERYVRPVITVPDANTAKAVFCVALLFNSTKGPLGANEGELLTSPAEGTA